VPPGQHVQQPEAGMMPMIVSGMAIITTSGMAKLLVLM